MKIPDRLRVQIGQRAMIKKGYVDTGEGQVHYRYTAGGSGFPLVLFHVNASSSEAYETLMQELDGKVPTFAIDMPNNGESFRTDHEPTMKYIGEVMLEVMSNLGAPRFHVIGSHTGASICLELACTAPERVVSATLMGICPVTPEEGEAWIRDLVYKNTPTERGSQLMNAWSRTLTQEKMYPAVAFPAETRHRECVSMLKAGENFGWAYVAVFTDDVLSKMEEVTRPIFFVIGEHDPIISLHMQIVEKYPQYPSHIAPGFGTFYSEHAPEDLAPRLLDFIRSSEAELKSTTKQRGE